MGADTKALRARIRSVDSTLHLTKAMGLVASSKIRRATEAMLHSRDYAGALERLAEVLSSCPECQRSPYMRDEHKDGEKLRLIVVAGDRGLAGGYNANVFRLMTTLPAAESVIAIGKRACERYGGDPVSSEKFSASDAYKLAQHLCREFAEGAYDRLGIVSTRYRSMLSQEAFYRELLPLKQGSQKNASVLFEPDELTVLNAAVPEYISGLIAASVRESFASEVAARRAAMDSAGKNAEAMIEDLRLHYNRARQSAITQEITEIVAGSDS